MWNNAFPLAAMVDPRFATRWTAGNQPKLAERLAAARVLAKLSKGSFAAATADMQLKVCPKRPFQALAQAMLAHLHSL